MRLRSRGSVHCDASRGQHLTRLNRRSASVEASPRFQLPSTGSVSVTSRSRSPRNPRGPCRRAAIGTGMTQVPVVTNWPACDAVGVGAQLVDEPRERDARIAEHVRAAAGRHLLAVAIRGDRVRDEIASSATRRRSARRARTSHAHAVSAISCGAPTVTKSL